MIVKLKREIKKYVPRQKTMVQQSRRSECYGPELIKRFVPSMRDQKYVDRKDQKIIFTDLTGVTDYHASMNVMAQMNTEFMKINPRIRARFGNDAGRFYNFVSKEENRDECIEMGLLKATTEDQDRISTAKRIAARKAAMDAGYEVREVDKDDDMDLQEKLSKSKNRAKGKDEHSAQ